jgi:hypothetical protein
VSNAAQYIAVANSSPLSGPVAVYMHGAMTQILVAEEQISPRLIAALSAVSTAIVAGLLPRIEPLKLPWGPVRIDLRDDVDTERIVPTITPSGIVVPIPRQLLTAEVARGLELLGTETMRWYNPPTAS